MRHSAEQGQRLGQQRQGWLSVRRLVVAVAWSAASALPTLASVEAWDPAKLGHSQPRFPFCRRPPVLPRTLTRGCSACPPGCWARRTRRCSRTCARWSPSYSATPPSLSTRLRLLRLSSPLPVRPGITTWTPMPCGSASHRPQQPPPRRPHPHQPAPRTTRLNILLVLAP